MRETFSRALASFPFIFLSFLMTDLSRYYSSDYKVRVVLYYIDHLPSTSFNAVAKLFKIPGGHKTVKRWYDQYNGSVSSLQSKPRSGRPPILTRRQIKKYILDPVIEANREPYPIHYDQIISQIKEKTNNDISIQTVRRYGHNSSGIKKRTPIPRTRQQCI